MEQGAPKLNVAQTVLQGLRERTLALDIQEIIPNSNYSEHLAQTRRLPTLDQRYALARLSSRDTGSAELLCYGYHVRATKRAAAETPERPAP